MTGKGTNSARGNEGMEVREEGEDGWQMRESRKRKKKKDGGGRETDSDSGGTAGSENEEVLRQGTGVINVVVRFAGEGE